MVHAKLAPAVADALNSGGAVVALESTLIAHGLPYPDNLQVAKQLESDVENNGAVPATIAIIDGEIKVGLNESDLEKIAQGAEIRKIGPRDLPAVISKKESAATTVASTSAIAHSVGIKLFATGGLGGVHRDANLSFDESADLTTLAQTPIAVVAAGVKSILDVLATLERLETLGVLVIGYQTNVFPGFYQTESGIDLEWRFDSAAEIANLIKTHSSLSTQSAIVIANPVAKELELPKKLHDDVLATGMAAAKKAGITGKAATPFLLEFFHRETKGESLRVNIDVVRGNASLAAKIAAELSSSR
ncbi:MAG: pseudouridine-5'-phosphate glycosidase [Actinobacteria bacterium]|nr:pseudouridine-5'-phosphate glycosidase [Actinomycetota bacterium]